MRNPTDEIHDLLNTIQATGNEDAILSARDLIWQFRAEALAKPNKERVDLLRVRLRTRLQELLRDAK